MRPPRIAGLASVHWLVEGHNFLALAAVGWAVAVGGANRRGGQVSVSELRSWRRRSRWSSP